MNNRFLSSLFSATILILIVAVAGYAVYLGKDGEDPLPQNTDQQVSASQTDSEPASDTDSVTDSSEPEPSDTDTKTDKTESTQPQSTSTQKTDVDSNSQTSNNYQIPENIFREDPFDGTFHFDAWNLILANPDNALPEGFAPELKTVNLNGYNATMDARVIDAMTAMFNAAKAEGITLIPRSTYRGIKEQSGYFYARIQQYQNQGMTYEQAWAKTATIIAVPGTSEHHTGLAADITTPSYNVLDAGYANTAAAKWLKAHCHEFGFILRYPKEKTEITKIIFEPWHFRYVGKEAAKIIMSEGICYEEFVERYQAQ